MTKLHTIKIDTYQSRMLARQLREEEIQIGRPLTRIETNERVHQFKLKITGKKRAIENVREDIANECQNLERYGTYSKRYPIR